MRDGLRRRGPLQHQRTFQPSNIRPLPLGGLSSIEGLRAPVAQLDRALPSEGKGRTFRIVSGAPSARP